MPHISHPYLLAVALALPFAAWAAPHYAYTAAGLTPGKSFGLSISNTEKISGSLGDGRAFLSAHGTLTPLGPLPGDLSAYGNGVNVWGQVAGMSWDGARSRAFVYSNGVLSDIGALNGAVGATAEDINDLGYVTGGAYDGQSWQAFVYRNGVMRGLGGLAGMSGSTGMAINNLGQIGGTAVASLNVPDHPEYGVKEHAFFYDRGVMKDLGTLGGNHSYGEGINEFGQVVGMSYVEPDDNELYYAFLYTHGALINLGTPVPGTSSWAKDINNLGQVVGFYAPPQSSAGRGFIYQRRGGMRDLNAMIDPSSGWYLHGAYSINDRQQIVGLGCKNGQYGAVLLNPVQRGGWLESRDADQPPPDHRLQAPENPPCPPG